MARFIGDQRTNYRVPHTLTCALQGVSASWFYKWLSRTPTPSQQRRAELDPAVAAAFKAARGLHGSPRLHADLREAGWAVSEKTVAGSLGLQGVIAPPRQPQERAAPAGQARAQVPRPAQAGLH